jgi:dienelactone hydrolase
MYYNRLAVATPRVNKFFNDLRMAQKKDLPIGAAGFCWGGKFVFLLSSDAEKTTNGKRLIDFGFTAHPSNLVLPVDAENVKLPLSVAIGDVDAMVSVAQAQQMKEILSAKNAGHDVVIIPGAAHGFATRAKPGDEAGTRQGVQAEDQAVNWFNKCFDGYRKASN